MSKEIEDQVKRRRTFAIISHPDAGKTTLTEKLLLYGGAIHLAGAVKAKSSQRKTTSDWMEIEKKRGISISTSVLQFDYLDKRINLLDTPGHKDFSEDTYRTLVAADAAVMLIDAAKGVEPQTRKLFEVCRMRGLPIFTFMNKLDRPSREPMDLVDELESVLGMRSSPVSWPIGMGDEFKGVYDRHRKQVLLYARGEEANAKKAIRPVEVDGVDSPEFLRLLEQGSDPERAKEMQAEMKEQIELLEVAGDPFDLDRVLAGELTPVFFGSALNNFGVQRFLENFLEMAPCPAARATLAGEVAPTSEQFSGLFFKIQANMDRMHRDRVSFMRVCSGHFKRGMAVNHPRLGKSLKLNKSVQFFGQERVTLEEAWPGDIIGLLDTSGEFRIGDTLCEGETFEYLGVPRFSPENFATVAVADPLKRKQLKKGLDQLSEEGVVQLFFKPGEGDAHPILGAVGALQFEVLEHRLKDEYGVQMKLERLGFVRACWVLLEGEQGAKGTFNFREFDRADSAYLHDRDGHPVVLFKSDWAVNWARDRFKEVTLSDTAPIKTATKTAKTTK